MLKNCNIMFYIVNYAYNPNTAISNRLLGYYSALDKLGVETSVIFLIPDKKKSKISVKYKNLQIIYLWEEGYYKNKLVRYIWTLINYHRFKRKLKSGDIVYTYGINPITKKLRKIKDIKLYAEKTEHISVSAGGFLTTLSKKGIIRVAKQLDGLFVISEPLKQSFIECGVDESKILIINMIVDPSRFKNLYKQQVTERYIAYCGTVSNNKDGVDQLLKAFAILAQKINDIKLYIIGDIPSANDKLNNLTLINTLEISDRIVFTGKVSAQDMPQILKNAEVLALDRPDSIQSRCGFPTKLGEYLLTGNPVVITKVGDIPKFLTDRVSALLAEESNPEEFASKLEWVLNHKDEAKEIGRRGANVAMENFNNEIETRKILEFIKKH